MAETQQIMATVVAEAKPKPPGFPLCHYAVVAWWRGGWWTLFPRLWMTRGSAEKAAEKLDPGWTHRYVVEISAPETSELLAQRASPESMQNGEGTVTSDET